LREEKFCNRCGLVKPVAEFYWSESKKLFLPRCIECCKLDSREQMENPVRRRKRRETQIKTWHRKRTEGTPKTCSDCLEEKSLENFSQGFSNCKACTIVRCNALDATGILKICKLCGKEKDRKFFSKSLKYKDGRRSYCGECRYSQDKEKYYPTRRFKLYGITEKWYAEKLKQQENRCEICDEYCTDFHIDHNHKTKKVRGLLCSKCNLLLGNAKESRTVLLKAVQYLAKYEGGTEHAEQNG
jgi:hypothetical protein